MLFSSWQFIFVFLPVTLGVFFLLPVRWRVPRKLWLVIASLFFYAYWKVEYVPLLVFSIGFNYGVAETMSRWRRRAGFALAFGVALNVLLLGYYKYTNFILDCLGRITSQPIGRLDIILPLAISFFTFTQIGYLVDVYRNPTLHYRFLDYALFVVFFPHLIAGPIVRHWEIIPQFADSDLKSDRLQLGLGTTQFFLGLFKKLLLADPVSVYAATVYTAAGQGVTLTWFDSWMGTLAFAIQIYFDFSAYSDMAIGLARMFGIKFPCNFASPYRASSIIEFWRRWHMSFSRWILDYIFMPLQMRWRDWRTLGTAAALVITFLISGIWHGAAWTFVVWGGLHGVYLLVAQQWRRWLAGRGWHWRHWSYRGACVLLTFFVVLISWVFFRSANLSTAAEVLGSMAGWHGFTIPESAINPAKLGGQWLAGCGASFVPANLPVASYPAALNITFFLLAVVWLLPNTQQLLVAYHPILEEVPRRSWLELRLNAWTGLALGALFFWVVRGYFSAAPSPFIYFNF